MAYSYMIGSSGWEDYQRQIEEQRLQMDVLQREAERRSAMSQYQAYSYQPTMNRRKRKLNIVQLVLGVKRYETDLDALNRAYSSWTTATGTSGMGYSGMRKMTW